jgi:hypothetical protein
MRRPRASNAAPLVAGTGGERLERRGGVVVTVGHGERRAVGPPIDELRVEPHQFDLLGERGARQPGTPRRTPAARDERRPDIERVAVATYVASLPPTTSLRSNT